MKIFKKIILKFLQKKREYNYSKLGSICNMDQATKLNKAKIWEKMSKKDIAIFQMSEKILCVPLEIFYSAVIAETKINMSFEDFINKYYNSSHKKILYKIRKTKEPILFKDKINLIPKQYRYLFFPKLFKK